MLMEPREQEYVFLTIIKGEDVLPCFMVSGEGEERVNLLWYDHLPGLFFLVSGAGSVLLVAVSKGDAGRHGINCGDSYCVTIREIWRIDNIPWVGEPGDSNLFPDHFQVSKTLELLRNGCVRGIRTVLLMHFSWYHNIKPKRTEKRLKRSSLNLCQRFTGVGTIINSYCSLT